MMRLPAMRMHIGPGANMPSTRKWDGISMLVSSVKRDMMGYHTTVG